MPAVTGSSPTPAAAARDATTAPPPAPPATENSGWSRQQIDRGIGALVTTADWLRQAPEHATPKRDRFADLVRDQLHRALAGTMTRDEVQFRFIVLLYSMPPAWHRDTGYAMRVEKLRTALGYPDVSVRRLEPLLASTTDAALQRKLLLQLLELCQVALDVARGWRLFDRFEAEHLANATPMEAVEFHRNWAAMLTKVGTLDAAEAKLQAAQQSAELAVTQMRPKAAAELQKKLRGNQLDLLLAAERFDRAEEMLAAARPDAFVPGHASIARALIAIRSGRREIAVTELATQTGGGQHALRAAAELTLLHVLDGDLAAAMRASEPLRNKPLNRLDTVQLVAVARVSLLAVAQEQPPAHQLGELEDALEEEYDKTLQRWAAVPPTESGVPFLFLASRRDLLATRIALHLERHGATAGADQGLRLLLDAETMGSVARTLKLSAPDLGTVRDRLLPRDGLLLAYLPAPTQSFVLGMTATECFAIPLPGDAGLRARVRTLRQLTGDQPTDGYQLQLAEAARPVVAWCLPAAVRARIDAHHHIAVVGRDLTGLIPFEALPYAKGGRELGVEKAIWSLPSMVLMSHYAARPKQLRDHSVAVLAATEVSADDQVGVAPIPADPTRWQQWTADGTGRGLVVAPASADDLLLGAGANARVAVVLAHGIRDLTTQRPHGLLLGRVGADRRGTVLADDIRTAADLLLLLVCNAASGPPRRGEDGGHHLGGALLRHGTRTVVLAEHDLELESTQLWADEFLTALRSDASVAEAARRARAEVRKRSGSRHPWFHAGLRVDGMGTLTLRDCGPLRPLEGR